MTSKFWMLALLVPALLLSGCSRKTPVTVPPEEAYRPGATPPGAKLVWPLPADPAASIAAAGLEQLTREGEIWHLHLHLEVFKDGQQVVIPANIGVGPESAFFSPIHTHTPDGVVHVESHVVKDYTLGQFFAEWGVSLAGARVLVNDEPAPEPEKVVFRNLDLITVTFGEGP